MQGTLENINQEEAMKIPRQTQIQPTQDFAKPVLGIQIGNTHTSKVIFLMQKAGKL